MRMGTRVRWLLAAVTALLLAGLAPAIGQPAVVRTAPAPVISPAGSIAGESVAITGKVPAVRPRPVVLQRAANGGWVAVQRTRTTRKGRYTFAVAASSRTYRVVAPRSAGQGRIVSRPVTAIPVPQSVAVAAPPTAALGEQLVVDAVAVPARAGRAMDLQRLHGGSWHSIAAGVQDAGGATRFTVGVADEDDWQLRAVASPSGGAATAASTPVTVRVTLTGEGEPTFPDAPGPVVRLTDTDPGARYEHTDFGLGGANVMSADGRYLVFSSSSTTILPGDDNEVSDSFLYDRQTGDLVLIGRDVDGGFSRRGSLDPSISADGRWIAYTAIDDVVRGEQGAGLPAVHLWDRRLDEVRIVSPTNSTRPSISADGSSIAYLGETDGADGSSYDVFVWSRATGTERLVSGRAADGLPAGDSDLWRPAISADGRYVTYSTSSAAVAPATPDVWRARRIIRWDSVSGQSVLVSATPQGGPVDGLTGWPMMSDDGRWVLYTADPGAFTTADPASEAPDTDALLWDAVTQTTTVVRRAAGELSSPTPSAGAAISPDGRYVYYGVSASTLFPATEPAPPGQGVRWDRQTGQRVLVTRAPDGTTADADSGVVGVSRDGRFLVLASGASNLVPDDENGQRDLFIADAEWSPSSVGSGFAVPVARESPPWSRPPSPPVTRTAALVSARPDGSAAYGRGGAVSDSGAFVAYRSEADDIDPADLGDVDWPPGVELDVFSWNAVTGRSNRITDGLDGSGANRASFFPSTSADGRWVLYESLASNLAVGDYDHDHDHDLFLWDRVTDQTTWVSRPAAVPLNRPKMPMGGGALSANGQYVAFWTDATTQAGDPLSGSRLYLWNRVTGVWKRLVLAVTTGRPTGDADWGAGGEVSVSNDGKVAFVLDPERIETGARAFEDVYLWTSATGGLTVVSRTPTGQRTNGSSASPAISADGRTVVFQSDASDLVPADVNATTDVFAWDSGTGQVRILSRSASGGPADGASTDPTVSADGSVVAFVSYASNLAAGETNRFRDAYVWRAGTGLLRVAPSAAVGPNQPTNRASISADGSRVAIDTLAWNWGVGDTNGAIYQKDDVYLVDAMP